MFGANDRLKLRSACDPPPIFIGVGIYIFYFCLYLEIIVRQLFFFSFSNILESINSSFRFLGSVEYTTQSMTCSDTMINMGQVLRPQRNLKKQKFTFFKVYVVCLNILWRYCDSWPHLRGSSYRDQTARCAKQLYIFKF